MKAYYIIFGLGNGPKVIETEIELHERVEDGVRYCSEFIDGREKIYSASLYHPSPQAAILDKIKEYSYKPPHIDERDPGLVWLRGTRDKLKTLLTRYPQ